MQILVFFFNAREKKASDRETRGGGGGGEESKPNKKIFLDTQPLLCQVFRFALAPGPLAIQRSTENTRK